MSTELALQLVETLGLDFHLGSAVMAIAEGDVGKAKLHIDRAAPNVAAAVRPLLPAPKSTRRHDDIPDLQVVQRTEPLSKRGRKPGKASAKTKAKGGREFRTCVECGKSKGATGFVRGDDSGICRACRTDDKKPAPKGQTSTFGKAQTSVPTGKQQPGTLVNGVYCMSRDEYHNHERGSTDGLYGKLRLLVANTELDTVLLTSPTGARVESVTREEIEGA